ncbi:Piso0_003413 [Millerozyma farinosa CBS 7064]|uniref:Piso0_003413 protein n=1 Tax=Pichia sorbitophila (strain ATCC MYA-4447 / BCRC 22081 / CBS 7064 / NBRC 10061 / NRRL Y-12695) TaxID=559304 RepID=G8YI13_PICSO|nr:Piso0_003413 [Millerozyma farinosa CBS 7064]CCE81065.1 Piso0_003413 [Millerozyma farinosa CBS 7064]
MTFKQAYKDLHRELRRVHIRTFESRNKKDIEKQRALLQYEKLQAVRKGEDAAKYDEQIKRLAQAKVPKLDTSLAKALIAEQQANKKTIEHLRNVATFIGSQREYTELLERYNPGLTMEQEEKVRRTAGKVGLSVPEK